MMLPADLAILSDPEFRKYVDIYAKDEKVFFDDFASAFSKVDKLSSTPFFDISNFKNRSYLSLE
jgi:cytochrome c peroxidase